MGQVRGAHEEQIEDAHAQQGDVGVRACGAQLHRRAIRPEGHQVAEERRAWNTRRTERHGGTGPFGRTHVGHRHQRPSSFA